MEVLNRAKAGALKRFVLAIPFLLVLATLIVAFFLTR
jgi:hypothetical protein